MTARVTTIFAVALAAAFLGCSVGPRADRADGSAGATKERLESAASAFTERLRSALLREMRKGPVQAVSVCSDSAQVITAMVAREFGVSIHRTSDRYRNPVNAPTSRELEILKEFFARKAEGLRIDTLEVFEPSQTEGPFRWQLSKPILVSSSVCLTCHGSESEIAPETGAILGARYPGDRARGYAVGDVRGILVVSEITPAH